MKSFKYENEKVSIVRELGVKDKSGTWVQIEFLTGEKKKSRIPIVKEELKPN